MQSDVREPAAGPGQNQTSPHPGDNGHAHRYPPPAEAISRLKQLIPEYKEYLSYYMSAKADGIKASIRNAGLYAVLGVVGLLAGGAIIVTACVLMLNGIAAGLGRLFGDRFWLGDLVVGVAVLAITGVGAWLMLSKLTGSFRSSTVKKYEQRQNWQRGQFGRNVRDAAAQKQ